jgi:hypothetical protein
MFASFRDAPCGAQTRNPAPRTTLDSKFAPSGAPRNDVKAASDHSVRHTGRHPPHHAQLGENPADRVMVSDQLIQS